MREKFKAITIDDKSVRPRKHENKEDETTGLCSSFRAGCRHFFSSLDVLLALQSTGKAGTRVCLFLHIGYGRFAIMAYNAGASYP
jgi:hypothetical protein